MLGASLGLLLPTQSSASTIRGAVTLPSGGGLSDALITIVQVGGEQGPWTAKTGPSGTYAISDLLIFGNLSISVSRPNTVFFPTSREFFDDGASTIIADFSAFTNSPVDTAPIQISRAGVTFDGGANPVGLPTTAFFEYGIAPSLDQRSTVVNLSGTSRQSTQFSLVPVPPAGSVIQARLVVSNSLGRSEGLLQQFTVPPQQFTTRFSSERSENAPPWSLQAADYNRDGQMDFVWLSAFQFNANPPYTGSGPDTWPRLGSCEACLPLPIQTAVFLDHNRDNKPDLLMSDTFGDIQIVQQAGSDGGFNRIFLNLTPSGVVARQLATDFNRDGRDDLVQLGVFFLVMIQAETGAFNTMRGDLNFRNQNAAVGDLNGDGYPDLVFSATAPDGEPTVYNLFGDGEGGLSGLDRSRQLTRFRGLLVGEIGLALSDLDGNGALDVLCMARLDSERIRLELYWNDGNGNFADRHITEFNSGVALSASPTMLTTGDFDNDGLEDVLFAGAPCVVISGRNRVVRMVSQPELSPSVGEAIRFDADGDGRLDLLVMGRTLEGLMSVQVMKNNLEAENRPPAAPVGLRSVSNGTTARFEWDAGGGDDLTPTPALTWNLRVGTRPGGSDIVSPLSDLSTGRRFVLNPGNAGQVHFFSLKYPKGSTNLFWSVQAIDAGYLGGAWAPEQVLRISAGEPLRLTDVVFEADGLVRVRATGIGLGAILNRSDDLIRWTPVGRFEAVGEGFEAIDTAPPASLGRYYSAR